LKKYKLDLSVEICFDNLEYVTLDLENVPYLVMFTGTGVIDTGLNLFATKTDSDSQMNAMSTSKES
jgi:hypothetical protein